MKKDDEINDEQCFRNGCVLQQYFHGYGLGVGGAAVFGRLTHATSKLAFFMPWQVLFGTGAAVALIAMLSCLLAMRRVLVLEPAVVFQG